MIHAKVRGFGGLAALLSFFMVSACGGPVVKNPTPVDFADFQPSNYPLVEEYQIQPGDQLDIKFFYNPELNELLIPVRPDGRISLQLVGEIRVAGRTPVELTKDLEEKYSLELKRPEITVILRAFAGQSIFVDGEVNRPGLINLVGPMSILQSIAQAGGIKDTAKPMETILIRRDKNHMPTIHTLNLEQVIDGTDMKQDILVQPFDIVYIPKSPIANANLWMQQYITSMVPFSIGMGYTGESGIGIYGATRR